MRYWWVNQKQTYRHEVPGGYLWSPKRRADNARNPFYDFMREVSPGDLIFSFAGGVIRAIGMARSFAYEAPKPLEFGQVGAYWETIGWRVDIGFHELRNRMRPADHIATIAPLLPTRYSPLRTNGHGLQNVYLTNLSLDLAGKLIDLIGREARDVIAGAQQHLKADAGMQTPGQLEWEAHETDRVRHDPALPETQRQAIIMARRGQGIFRENVRRLEGCCRITGVRALEHLRASHCKPWRDSTNEERLDGENGLLLTPNADHLFDRGFIGFEGDGTLLISPIVDRDALSRLGIESTRPVNVGHFSDGQRKYLDFHRESVMLHSFYLDANR